MTKCSSTRIALLLRCVSSRLLRASKTHFEKRPALMRRPFFYLVWLMPRSPYAVLAVSLLGISIAGPLVRLSSADPVIIAVWRLGFSLAIVAVALVLSGQWRDWRRIT